jgi:hypothetical protein
VRFIPHSRERLQARFWEKYGMVRFGVYDKYSVAVEQNSKRKLKFLIVENDPNDAFLIRRALGASERCGLAFICRNPSEARSLLKGAGIYENRDSYLTCFPKTGQTGVGGI